MKVLLFNHGEAEYQVKEGERVAQLVLERVGLSAFNCLFSSFVDASWRGVVMAV